MKQLLVFKFEGMALLTRLIMLIIASPVLWFADAINFSIDVAKTINKKKLVLKTVMFVLAVIAIIHLVENACGELNELYFEILKITWLSLKIVGTSTIYVSIATLCILMFLLLIFTTVFVFQTQASKISSGKINLLDEIFWYCDKVVCMVPHSFNFSPDGSGILFVKRSGTKRYSRQRD